MKVTLHQKSMVESMQVFDLCTLAGLAAEFSVGLPHGVDVELNNKDDKYTIVRIMAFMETYIEEDTL